AVEQHHRLLAVAERIDRAAVPYDRDDGRAARRKRFVAEEDGRRERARDIRGQGRLAVELARRARAFALLLHRRLEARHVDRQAALARDVRGEVDREAVGIVQAECVGAGNGIAGLARDILEHLHALLEGLAETLLFGLERALDELALGRQFR